MKREKGLLYYIYCALGEKSHPNCDKTADRVAFIRLAITLQILITNFFIIGGVIINAASIARHWERKTTNIEVKLYENPNSSEILYPEKWNSMGMGGNARIEGVYHSGTIKNKPGEFE